MYLKRFLENKESSLYTFFEAFFSLNLLEELEGVLFWIINAISTVLFISHTHIRSVVVLKDYLRNYTDTHTHTYFNLI